jgi:hypothetical protein
MQWFIFMTIAIVGYPIEQYKVAHSRGSEGRNLPPDYDDQLVSGGDIATDVVSRG